MIFTKLKIDNLYSFKNCEFDFSFSRKIKDSAIASETLPGHGKFNYKKVCVIAGPNASGKTSLGRILCGLQNFIVGEYSLNSMLDAVCDKELPAFISAEFVTKDSKGNFSFNNLQISFKSGDKLINNFKCAQVPILKNDSVSTVRSKIEALLADPDNPDFKRKRFIYIDEKKGGLAKFAQLDFLVGWRYLLSDVDNIRESLNSNLDKKLLYSVLKTLDQSIKEISEVYETDKNQKELRGFLVRFNNNDTSLIDLTGKATNQKRFSRGTFEGIKVAEFISDIKARKSNCLFFIDEQMAHSHVEIEISILNAMIQFLGEFCQLFFTTHNYEVLDMNLPVHSYLFLSRQGKSIKVVNPERIYNKNDRSLLNAVKNNVFKTIPETDLLDSLLFNICD